MRCGYCFKGRDHEDFEELARDYMGVGGSLKRSIFEYWGVTPFRVDFSGNSVLILTRAKITGDVNYQVSYKFARKHFQFDRFKEKSRSDKIQASNLNN